MDYHLDWLYAALVITRDGVEGLHASPGGPDDPVGNVNANQEDVDFLVAFDDGDVTHIVLIEAKADTGWTNKQMTSKATRLSRIFDPSIDPLAPEVARNAAAFPGVRPHFVLTSPTGPPTGLHTLPRPPAGASPGHPGWPEWMRRSDGSVAWLPLDTGDAKWRITRCDENGRPMRTGVHWRVASPPGPK